MSRKRESSDRQVIEEVGKDVIMREQKMQEIGKLEQRRRERGKHIYRGSREGGTYEGIKKKKESGEGGTYEETEKKARKEVRWS